MPTWFHSLFGCEEEGDANVKANLVVQDGKLYSKANGKEYAVGQFSTPTLEELRSKAKSLLEDDAAVAASKLRGKVGVRTVLGDVANYHRKEENRHALFQVASQLNCLEFPNPRVTPEQGVTGYAYDRTQGPCCAIACGAGTVFRNYFAPVHDASGKVQHGQTDAHQIECLRDLAAALENDRHGYLRVQGGYTLADDEGLAALKSKLDASSEPELDALRAKLRVGVQSDVEVTGHSWGKELVGDPKQLVTQVFGSACSVSYSGNKKGLWEPMAKLILEASYEATLWAAVISALRHKGADGSRSVFLTALGGGVFGNSMSWIEHSIQRAIDTVCKEHGLALQINLVSYCEPVDPSFLSLVDSCGSKEALVNEAPSDRKRKSGDDDGAHEEATLSHGYRRDDCTSFFWGVWRFIAPRRFTGTA